ncbi:hypothetical protein H0H87_007580 [Tephrocybe sp. NHM501043]|nr:hypothetical protein H0H87_007580 [Tephrocybe sp. NHM501043]
MHNGFQMIAHILYPITEPKFYAVASEVAMMAFLRAHDLPVPEVYGYSPMSDNAAKSEKGRAFSKRLQLANKNVQNIRGMIGFETETWVPSSHYRKAKALAELVKLKVLMAILKEELQDKTQANWFLDDMDEEDYM